MLSFVFRNVTTKYELSEVIKRTTFLNRECFQFFIKLFFNTKSGLDFHNGHNRTSNNIC